MTHAHTYTHTHTVVSAGLQGAAKINYQKSTYHTSVQILGARLITNSTASRVSDHPLAAICDASFC